MFVGHLTCALCNAQFLAYDLTRDGIVKSALGISRIGVSEISGIGCVKLTKILILILLRLFLKF